MYYPPQQQQQQQQNQQYLKQPSNGGAPDSPLPRPIEFRRKVILAPKKSVQRKYNKTTPESKLLEQHEPDDSTEQLVPTVELYPIKMYYSIVDGDTTGGPRPPYSSLFFDGTASADPNTPKLAATTRPLVNGTSSPSQSPPISHHVVQTNDLILPLDDLNLASAKSASAPSSPRPPFHPSVTSISSSSNNNTARDYRPPMNPKGLRRKVLSLPVDLPEDSYPPLGFVLVSRTTPVRDALVALSKMVAPEKSSSCIRLWKRMNYGQERATAQGDGYELVYLDESLEGKLLSPKNVKLKNAKQQRPPPPGTTPPAAPAPAPPMTVGEWVECQGGNTAKSVALLLESRANPNARWSRESLELENRIQVGDFVDAQDTTGKWYESIVRKVTEDTVTVHYAGWASRWNTTLRRYKRGGAIVGTPKVSCNHDEECNTP